MLFGHGGLGVKQEGMLSLQEVSSHSCTFPVAFQGLPESAFAFFFKWHSTGKPASPSTAGKSAQWPS